MKEKSGENVKHRMWRHGAYPGFHDRPYAVLCAAVARQRGCSEFDLFRTAYSQWYGKPAAEREIERLFVRFIFYHETPFWVRQYLQSVRPCTADINHRRVRALPFSDCWKWLLQIMHHRFCGAVVRSSSVLVA